MKDAVSQPRPWLGLFQTDFSKLCLEHSNATHPPSETFENEPCTINSDKCLSAQGKEHSSHNINIFSLPSEVLQLIFSLLEAEQLSNLAQVSSKFLSHVYQPLLWRRIALKTWPCELPSELERKLHVWKTWRKMCTHRPRLRTNGVYVLRHQFAKTSTRSATEEPIAPVFLVTYYRFLRFYADGTVVSLTTPEMPHLAIQRVRRGWQPAFGERGKVNPSIGHFVFHENLSQVAVSLPLCHSNFPSMRSGMIYMHLTLSSTAPGACNRLFLTDHYAIMDHDGGDLIPYRGERRNPFRLVPIWGFRSAVYREFPRDDDMDLAQWFEMKKALRTSRQ